MAKTRRASRTSILTKPLTKLNRVILTKLNSVITNYGADKTRLANLCTPTDAYVISRGKEHISNT